MTRQFDALFDEWSMTYDHTVKGSDIEYKEVFEGYDDILSEVAKKAKGYIFEFGAGTGNLTEKMIKMGKQVYGIEPSEGMRRIARKKLPGVTIVEGDFLEFPMPKQHPDTIVSTYAFHHLTDDEKTGAIQQFGKMLGEGGRIVFADTIFVSNEAKQDMIKEAESKQFNRLAADLKSEFYTTIPKMNQLFGEAGFDASFTQKNRFVWLAEAMKRRE
ncbi:class I SAM-dependent methyltransferase [Siminovitchia sp. 179-K 8D1 HS]|uniref:class I SAM-dependent methyltransferase n=1 Tax=Siminovitchia sp. 179-K 8D1 HS TaxID=3142385 RepID=UPI0039A0ECE3